MATVGIAALRPDLVVLDEFQRFKDLLDPDPTNFAAELAHRLFNYVDPESGQPTRTLLLSATPYRMYTTADEVDGDHYADFLSTCSFLFRDAGRVDQLRIRFADLRRALTSTESLGHAESICQDIGADLRSVMARTERLGATPDRDGMLRELDALVSIEPDDLRSYQRLGDLAEAVEHHEPTEYWKAGPYLFNFMERYKLKVALDRAAADRSFPKGRTWLRDPASLAGPRSRPTTPSILRMAGSAGSWTTSAGTEPSTCCGCLHRCVTTTPGPSTSPRRRRTSQSG